MRGQQKPYLAESQVDSTVRVGGGHTRASTSTRSRLDHGLGWAGALAALRVVGFVAAANAAKEAREQLAGLVGSAPGALLCGIQIILLANA